MRVKVKVKTEKAFKIIVMVNTQVKRTKEIMMMKTTVSRSQMKKIEVFPDCQSQKLLGSVAAFEIARKNW